jgi:multiple sugar transport system substrate-binding protein
MRIPQRRGRAAALVAVSTAVVLTLAGCGSSSDSSSSSASGDSAASSGEPVELRFAWWGSDSRHKTTQKVIDAYEAEHPNVTINGEFSEFSGYWDKLATATAAKDAPDIIQMDEKYLRDYAGRGALLDLTTESDVLSTADFDENALKSGQFDGGLYGLSTGVNAYSILANPEMFAAAGVEMPDDTTWTWDDYKAICLKITEGSPDGTFGCQSYGNEEAGLSQWARQHGESLYTDDGQIGFTPETLTSWWTDIKARTDAGATPPASFTTEEATSAVDQSGLATHKVAMGLWWTNQVPSLEAASGKPLVLLRQPSVTGKSADNGMYYKSSMFWSASSQSDHPKEAAEFINFLANSPEAGKLIGVDRGVQSNTVVREAVVPTLTPTNAAAVEFVEAIGKDITSTPAPPPIGGGAVQPILMRYTSEVLFERMTPEEAANAFIDEVKNTINQG